MLMTIVGRWTTCNDADMATMSDRRHTARHLQFRASPVTQCTAAAQVQLAERVSRDANVVQVYGAAVAEEAVLLVMELMQARVGGS